MVTKRLMTIIETENEGNLSQFSCKKNFVKKSYSTVTQPKTAF